MQINTENRREIKKLQSETYPRIEKSWKTRLMDEFKQPYMESLREFLRQELAAKKQIYPRPAEFFAAFDATPFEQVRVVILGQDPYHGPRQAHGLCFSVRPEVELPPSLVNIYKELQADLGIPPADHGFLQTWSRQGVLLLNSVLSVEAGRAASHQNRGWERFTDRAIHLLNAERDGIAFVLWGAYAQKKGQFIDRKKHLVLETPHPSPLSAHRGFFGSRPFSKINTYLRSKDQPEIDWRLPSRSSLSS